MSKVVRYASLVIPLLAAGCATTESAGTVQDRRPSVPPFRNGIELVEDCNRPDAKSVGFCEGYVAGATDMLTAFRTLGGFVDCRPATTTTVEVRSVVLNYINSGPTAFKTSKPGASKDPAMSYVVGALNQEWGCGIPDFLFNPNQFGLLKRPKR